MVEDAALNKHLAFLEDAAEKGLDYPNVAAYHRHLDALGKNESRRSRGHLVNTGFESNSGESINGTEKTFENDDNTETPEDTDAEDTGKGQNNIGDVGDNGDTRNTSDVANPTNVHNDVEMENLCVDNHSDNNSDHNVDNYVDYGYEDSHTEDLSLYESEDMGIIGMDDYTDADTIAPWGSSSASTTEEQQPPPPATISTSDLLFDHVDGKYYYPNGSPLIPMPDTYPTSLQQLMRSMQEVHRIQIEARKRTPVKGWQVPHHSSPLRKQVDPEDDAISYESETMIETKDPSPWVLTQWLSNDNHLPHRAMGFLGILTISLEARTLEISEVNSHDGDWPPPARPLHLLVLRVPVWLPAEWRWQVAHFLRMHMGPMMEGGFAGIRVRNMARPMEMRLKELEFQLEYQHDEMEHRLRRDNGVAAILRRDAFHVRNDLLKAAVKFLRPDARPMYPDCSIDLVLLNVWKEDAEDLRKIVVYVIVRQDLPGNLRLEGLAEFSRFLGGQDGEGGPGGCALGDFEVCEKRMPGWLSPGELSVMLKRQILAERDYRDDQRDFGRWARWARKNPRFLYKGAGKLECRTSTGVF